MTRVLSGVRASSPGGVGPGWPDHARGGL